jgi:small subunit ribosomal protein S15
VAEKTTTKDKVKNDTGLPESQIRIFTGRINSINEHLKINKKDNSSRRGLMILVSKRKKMLKYLQKRNLNDYTSLIKELKIRK